MSEVADKAIETNDRDYMICIRYTTKLGDRINHVIFLDMEADGDKWFYENVTFEKWFSDRLQYEGGWFPYEGGRIHADALLKVEEVSRGPAY